MRREQIIINTGTKTFTFDSTDFTDEIKSIMPRCIVCDSNNSYELRVETFNRMINKIIELTEKRLNNGF